MNVRDDDALRARYPALFAESEFEWPTARVRVVFELADPDPTLTSNVRMIAFVGEQVVVMETVEYGWGGLPGGTLEPGESVADGLRREVMEEVGAVVQRYTPFGRARFHSYAPSPLRAHIPHPEFHAAVVYGDVEIVGPPTQPDARAEHIVGIDQLPVEEATARLEAAGKPWDAALVQLAADLRRSAS